VRNSSNQKAFRGRRRIAGYTLVALLVGITILSIVLGAVGPIWSRVVQRDREEELIFRGKQYVEGIRMFQKRNGRPPTQLKELVEIKPRSIRKLYKDPITNSDNWGLIFPGGITSDNLGGTGGPGGAAGGFLSGGGATGGAAGNTGGSPKGGAGSGFNPVGQGSQVASGPIIGVYSRSTARSIRIYKGRQRYSDWKFTTQNAQGVGPGSTSGLNPN